MTQQKAKKQSESGVQRIAPKAGCPFCHGTGTTYDVVDWGSQHVRMESMCECVMDQLIFDDDEIILVNEV